MKFVPKTITKSVARAILKSKKNSPSVFFVGGIIGVTGATVLACKATLNLEEVLEGAESRISDVSESDESLQVMSDNRRMEHYKDVAWVYSSSAYDVAKLYAPAVIVGAISIGALTGSHVTLVRRNTALTATVASLASAFDMYRERVRDSVGFKRELEIYQGRKAIVVDQDGESIVVKENTGSGFSNPYTKLFDEFNPNWEKYPEYNRNFVLTQERVWNHKLQTRGHVFLNEVYDALGFERTPEGQVVGWVLDDGSYIDFGLYTDVNELFMDGHERSAWLDFNVDGVIYDKI